MPNDPLPPKVFGIGLARTGTTTLYRAFSMLGLRAAPTSVALLDDPNDQLLDRFDAFTDNPVPFMYREMAERFPSAQFVWSTRPLDEWLSSMEWLFGPGIDQLDRNTRKLGDRVHETLYGITRFDAAVLTQVHGLHGESVAAWAAGRADVLHIELDNLSWAPICSHLGKPIPAAPFPHLNAAS